MRYTRLKFLTLFRSITPNRGYTDATCFVSTESDGSMRRRAFVANLNDTDHALFLAELEGAVVALVRVQVFELA